MQNLVFHKDLDVCQRTQQKINLHLTNKPEKRPHWASILRDLQKIVETFRTNAKKAKKGEEIKEDKTAVRENLKQLINRLSVVLLCGHLLPEGLRKGILRKLEIDHRGGSVSVVTSLSSPSSSSSSHFPDQILKNGRVYRMGESKSGRELGYAVEQLFIRLYIVSFVAEWIFREKDENFFAAGEGLIICPRPSSLKEKIERVKELKPGDPLWFQRIGVKDMLIAGRSY